MASDIARVSYDESRRYHAVVKQQGRVELEADDNEATTIIDELLRTETLDIIGPTGSPDDGYKITPAAAGGDFSIGAGTIYVGGMRISQPDPNFLYSAQSDWLDRWASPEAEALGDPVWIDPAAPGQPHELAYLFLREQEVSAVEDMTLREVALGGPDTAQRKRLIARVVRRSVNSGTCDVAMAQMVSEWPGQGLEFDPATMRLNGLSRLQASYTNPNPAADPCEPDAHGGYLGAENQLIRVQIAMDDKFVWGYDNASFLYRVTVEPDNRTLKLLASPVDAHHFPAVGQAVELLLPAANLADDNFVAAHTGHVEVLSAGYTADTRAVQLANALPAGYRPAAGAVLFMRVWEKVETLVPGTDVTLGNTGLNVNITGAAFHAGDFWQIAVRPATPIEVYPKRYLDGPQPPDGPRIWITPLALDSNDCREPFDNLVELTKRKVGGCCTYSVTTVAELREAVTQAMGRPVNNDEREPVRICIQPGVYEIRTPIVLQSTSDLIISGCGAQSIINCSGAAFITVDCARVTLEGLTIRSREDTPAAVVGWSSELRVTNCDISAVGDNPAILVLPGASDITVEESELAGGPPLAACGSGLRIVGNRMSGGGVWLGEGSADVLIRKNQIGGGTTEIPWPGVLIGGSLSSQYDPDNNLESAPETLADTRISRVEISCNQIEGLLGCGIATFAPRGDGSGLLVSDVTIFENAIVGCASSERGSPFELFAPGGIVLRYVEGVTVRQNESRRNGLPEKLRACGIFLEGCTSVRLVGNKVNDNGWSGDAANGLYQGGIIVLDAWPDTSNEVGRGPAVIAHENVVVSPLGQSLLIDAIGAVSVVGNSLNTQGITEQPNFAEADLGRAVFIRSLGSPNERKLRDALSTGNVHVLLRPGVDALLDGEQWPDGRVLVSDNQVSARVMGGQQENAAVAVHSLDDVSFQDNQVRLEGVEGILTDVAVIGATVRASGNRVAEPEHVGAGTFFSYLSTGAHNIATGNQVTHCLLVGGPDPIDQLNQVLYPQGCEEIVEAIREGDIRPDAIGRPYVTMLNSVDPGRVRARLEGLAERAAERMEALNAIVENARTTLGSDDPRTKAMAERAEADAALATSLEARAASVREAPKLEREGEALIHGRITTPAGEPVPGLVVRVVPRGESLAYESKDVTSANDGTFEIRYSPDEVEKLREEGETLALSVRISTRNTLTSDDPITLTSGSVEFFDISVPKPRRRGGGNE